MPPVSIERHGGRAGDSGSLTRRDVLSGAAAALAVAGGMPLLASCGRGGGQSAAKPKLTFLNIIPLTSLTFSPELLGVAGGYFADQGIDVAFQSTHGSPQAIQLVIAGSAPLTRIGQIETVRHIANSGAPIMNIGTVLKESTIRFVSSAKAPLHTPADFAGKTVGVPSEGGSSATTLDLLLASANIDRASVQTQVVGLGPGVFNLVEQGRIAGFAVSIDTAKILEKQMSGVVVLRPGQFIQSGAQLYMASKDGLAEHRELLRKYLAAVDAAIEFMIGDDGFDKTLQIMRKKYSFKALQDAAIAKASLSDYVEGWTSAGKDNILRTVPDKWQRGYEELVRAGQAKAGKDPSQWFTNELIPA
jgi:NitT/TauT family transport system substrate-binding protein